MGRTRWRWRWAELSFLFDRVCGLCGIRLSGETRAHGQSAGAFPASSSPPTALETLPAVLNPRHGVPITASGPRGEQPLLDMNNAGKGSRQIGPVTLGKGLALVLRGRGCLCVEAERGLLGAGPGQLGSVLGGFCTVSAADDAHGMQQTRTATGKGNPTV